MSIWCNGLDPIGLSNHLLGWLKTASKLNEQMQAPENKNLISQARGYKMQKLNVFIYGVISYLIFFITFLYAIGFVGNIFVSKGIDTGEPRNLTTSVIVNIGLLGLFGVQHSIMARQKFKKCLTSFIPIAAERSTYVLFSSLILALLIWQWKPMPDFVWHIEA